VWFVKGIGLKGRIVSIFRYWSFDIMWFNWAQHKHRGLRGWVLYILEISPKNGAEIMDAMEGMSQGHWRPSPGSIYPLLESMSKEGTIKKLEDGRYELTSTGKEEVGWPSRMRSNYPRSIEDVLSEMNSYVSYLEDLAKAKDTKLTPHLQQIKDLQNRLSKIGTQ
jgi:DNA-binding PadR family transcriptional regulator